jgi:hypothetical protein
MFASRTREVMQQVLLERHNQDEMRDKGRFRYTCADDGLSDGDRLAILTEELGEVARAMQGQEHRRLSLHEPVTSPSELRRELVQVAAIAIAWAERLLD